MKRFIWIGLLALLSAQWMQGQHFPKMDTRNYVSDSTVFMPKKPWLAAGEVFGLNVGIWAFDRFLMNEDFAHINGHTIKNNFKQSGGASLPRLALLQCRTQQRDEFLAVYPFRRRWEFDVGILHGE